MQSCTKVAVMGASGGIGQPLSLLLKQSPLVTQLNLYDIVHTPGVAADLSHMNTKAKVTGFVGPDQLKVTISSHPISRKQLLQSFFFPLFRVLWKVLKLSSSRPAFPASPA